MHIVEDEQRRDRPRPARGEPLYLDSIRSILFQTPRILLVKLRSLGDSILALPLLDALHQWRPELESDVLIESPYAPVFSGHPSVHATLVLKPRQSPARAGWSKGKALLEVRRRRYPVVINLHGGTTSLLFSIAGGAGLRIGFEYYRQSWLYNVRIPSSAAVWGREKIHTVEHMLAPLRWLGIPVSDEPRCSLHLEESARARLRERLERSGIPWRGFIHMHPTATLSTKQWPPAQFAQLADLLHNYYGMPTVFTSAPNEAQTLLDVRRCSTVKHQYWSDLALDELFALAESCHLFVGNDSGPTHAAAALHRPVVVVWGSSNFNTWRPWGTCFELVRSDLSCMPCPGYTCAAFGMPRCILEIPVESVLQACHRLLARSTA